MHDHRWQDGNRAANKQTTNNRRDLLTNVYTKNERALRERILRRNNKSANRNHNADEYKGLTLEDYVRGRSSSQKLKTQTRKDSSVIKLRRQEGQLLFASNYEIKEQDEENYTEKKEPHREIKLPQIKRGRAILQTEKSLKDPNRSHAARMKTSVNALQELRGIYKGYSLRKSGSRTKNPGRESVFDNNMETPYDHKMKLKTMSQFYRGRNHKELSDSPARQETKYSTKYGWDTKPKSDKRHSMLHYL